MISIQSLLTDPFTDVCMEPEIGNLYVHNRTMFDAVARQWTWKYAMWDALSAKAIKDIFDFKTHTEPQRFCFGFQ